MMRLDIELLAGLRQKAIVLRLNGMTCEEIASALCMSDSWVHKWTPRSGKQYKPWSDKEKDKAERMRVTKRSCGYIAKKLGRSEQSVRLCLWRMDKRLIACRNVNARKEAEGWLLKAIALGAKPTDAMKAVRRAAIVGR